MTKFRTDITKGGYKILSLHGPDECEEFAGVIDTGGSYLTITWYDTGVPVSANDLYSLIPLDEPKPDPSDTTELWNYVHSSSKEINALRELVEGVIRRMESMQQDYIARINGLRADYLADQSTVQPSRMDGIEERLEELEYDNKESNTWGVHVNGDLQELHNRILKLERKTADTSDYHNLRLQIQDVEKQLKALEQRTKTDEKGVWVTTKTFWDACWSQVSVKGEPLEDLFERMAKQLGLEE